MKLNWNFWKSSMGWRFHTQKTFQESALWIFPVISLKLIEERFSGTKFITGTTKKLNPAQNTCSHDNSQ